MCAAICATSKASRISTIPSKLASPHNPHCVEVAPRLELDIVEGTRVWVSAIVGVEVLERDPLAVVLGEELPHPARKLIDAIVRKAFLQSFNFKFELFIFLNIILLTNRVLLL